MKKILLGLLFGAIAGVIDVAPMVIQKLSFTANLSAFSLWLVVGFLLSVTGLKINSILKGILLAFLVLLPCAIIIGAQEPASLMPISVMALILGGGLGYAVGKLD